MVREISIESSAKIEMDLRSGNAALRAEEMLRIARASAIGDGPAIQALAERAEIAERLFPHHETVIEDLLYIQSDLKCRIEALHHYANK